MSMPRIARVCAEGYPHHITQRGNNKEKTFFDNEDKQFYLESLIVEEEPYLWAVIKIYRAKSGKSKTCQTGRRLSMVKCKSLYIGHKR
jgi:hypothetical protein